MFQCQALCLELVIEYQSEGNKGPCLLGVFNLVKDLHSN